MHSDGAETGGEGQGSGSALQGASDQPLVVERLGDHHKIADFKCLAKAKSPRVQNFLLNQAVKYDRSNFARIFIFSPQNDPARVLGFYTLSAAIIRHQEVVLSGSQLKKVPGKINYPMATLGYMGKADDCDRQGLGDLMMVDAATRLTKLDAIGVWGIVLDAELGDPSAAGYTPPDPAKDKLVAWYKDWGFVSVADQPPSHIHRMYAKLSWILD